MYLLVKAIAWIYCPNCFWILSRLIGEIDFKKKDSLSFKYLTWNTNGINDLSKCRKAHLTDAEHARLACQWQGQTFYFTSQSQGVATLIGKNVPLQVDNIEKDKQGRYLILKGSLSHECIRCAKNINTSVVALSLDAEKAFDRLEWHYLFAVLEKMNFGQNLIQMINILYLNPSAMIQTNADISSLFPLSRGTHQGCPLSPLFLLVVEPLAIAIRAHPVIEGIMVEDKKHVISLYADDIMLYLTNMETSLPALCTLLEEYSCISGHKINKQKSVMMPLNPAAQGLSRGDIPFHWDPCKFCYLGLQISNQLHQIYSLNYESLFKKVEADLDRLKSLPISLIGRMNCIKMNILPKFLYLFQSLPTPILKTFFKTLTD